jgi:ComEC/Rec2-related protein
MSIGLRDLVARDVAADFRTTGLSHVVAISGWHIAMLGAVVGGLLGGIGRRPRTAIVLAAIVAYAIFAGASPSVLRATVMAVVVLLARESGRRGSASAGLALTVAGMLLLDPQTIADIGFQLSAAATAGLLIWAKRARSWLENRLPRQTPGWLLESLGVSMAAQAATLPMVLFHFGTLSLVSPLANVLIGPLVAPAMLLTGVALVCGLLIGAGVPALLFAPFALVAGVVIGAMIAIAHVCALLPFASLILAPPLNILLAAACCALLAWSLMLSQALESVTRAFYTRADLDLILSSPVAPRKVFAVRMATMALSITALALLLAAPFINVLAIGGGARWLAAYGAVVALGGIAAAVALALTVALFRAIGPRRTRLVAQILAAVIGAAFVIGLQVVAIVSADTTPTGAALSRYAVLGTDAVLRLAPDAESIVWWPARAILGDGGALTLFLATSLATLVIAILVVARNFADHVIAASGLAQATSQPAGSARAFRQASPKRMLRRKEWMLLKRDPWLVSQTLMQLLYLLPPALLLWRSFGSGGCVRPVRARARLHFGMACAHGRRRRPDRGCRLHCGPALVPRPG